MRILFALCGIAAFGCVQVNTAWASDQETETLLASMRKAYGAVKSAKFSSLVYATPPLHPLGCTSYFLSPGFYRVDSKDIYGETPPRDATFMTDGKLTHVTMKGSNRTESEPYSLQEFYNISPGNVESFSFFAGNYLLSDAKGKNLEGCTLRTIRDQKWAGKSWTVLEDTIPGYGVYKFYIDPKTYFIWRTTAVKTSGELRVDTQIKSLDVDAKVSPSLFKPGAASGSDG